jgi:hypothetical protein
MKKLFAVIMVAGLVVGVLTGCGGQADATKQAAPNEESKKIKTYSNEEIMNAMMAVGYSTESYETETKGQIRTDVKGDFSKLEEGLKAEVIKALSTAEVAHAKVVYTTAKEYQIVVYQGADKIISTINEKNS